jgi:hypothetical protein
MVTRLMSASDGRTRFVQDDISIEERSRWERGTVWNWMEESYRIGKEFVYPALPAGFACGEDGDEVQNIRRDYYRQAETILAKQLRKAGVRLAYLLNRTLK